MSSINSLLNLDFATLRTFRLVYQLGSFSAAAEEIDVKQSTVSYTIDRLRKVVGDPLFVRQGGKNSTTSRCREIIPLVENLLADAEGLLEPSEFEPENYVGEFTITCVGYVSNVILPSVVKRLRTEAPFLKLVVRSGYFDFKKMLVDAKADLAITPTEIDGSGIYRKTLLTDDFPVLVMDKNNPLVGKELSVSEILSQPHVEFRAFPTFKAAYYVAAQEQGLDIQPVLAVTDASDIPSYVAGTELISPMPSRMAMKHPSTLGIAHAPFRKSIGNVMHWMASSNSNQLNSWVRGIIEQEVENLGPPHSL